METQEPAKSFLYDLLLPKVEKLGLLVTVLSIIAALTLVGRYETLLIVGIGTLSITSFLYAFSPYNSIATDEPYFEPVYKQTVPDRKPSFFLDTLAPKIAGIAGGVVLVGTLFKLMFWSGNSMMLSVGTAWLLVIVVTMAFNQRMNMRAFILAIVGSAMLNVSSEMLMRQLHRDDPQLVKLMVYQIQHPHDRAAAQAVRMRMNQMRHRR